MITILFELKLIAQTFRQITGKRFKSKLHAKTGPAYLYFFGTKTSILSLRSILITLKGR